MTESRAMRISIIGVIALALFSALFARLWYLQVAAGHEYAAAATSQRERTITEPPLRGRILDAKGRVLAENRIANVITVDRKLGTRQRNLVLDRLALVLQKPVTDLRKRLDDPRIAPYAPVPVAVDVPFDALAYVAEHREDFPGVRAEPVAFRVYPNGHAASHVLGYVGEINDQELKQRGKSGHYELGDQIGKAGVERTFESQLRGVPGRQTLEIDSSGRVLRTIGETKSSPGDDVKLTLDLDVQKAAEDSLVQGILAARATRDTGDKTKFTTFKAPAGSVVVLDALTGSVVAMASYPDFDPGQFVNGIPTSIWKAYNDPASHYPLLNRAVAGQYAPGSTFKLVTSIAGLSSGDITPGKTILDRGSYAYPTDPKRAFTNDNHAVYGRVALARAITVSSDVYYYTIGGDLYARQKRGLPGGDALQVTARAFGLGQPTGIALPDEASGRVPDAAWKERIHAQNPVAFPYADWLPGDSILSAIGQGDMLVTPLQLANAYATFVDGGTLYQPRLVSEVLDASGRKVRTLAPVVKARVTVPARDTMLTGFRGVVASREGTAYAAFAGAPANLAAGKTGTAQVQGRQPTSLFVGMTPADNPRYVVAVVVEEGGYGSQTAAPIARRVIEALAGLPLSDVATSGAVRGN